MIIDTIYDPWMQIQLGRREGILSPLVKTRGCYIFLGLNSRFQFMQRANQDIWGAHIQLKFHFSLLCLERTHVSLRTVLVTFRLHQSMELPSTSSLTNAGCYWGAALGNGKDFFCEPHQVPFSAKLHIFSRAFWWDEDSVATHLRSGEVL